MGKAYHARSCKYACKYTGQPPRTAPKNHVIYAQNSDAQNRAIRPIPAGDVSSDVLGGGKWGRWMRVDGR